MEEEEDKVEEQQKQIQQHIVVSLVINYLIPLLCCGVCGLIKEITPCSCTLINIEYREGFISSFDRALPVLCIDQSTRTWG